MGEFRPQIAPQHDIKIQKIATELNMSKQSVVSMLLDAQLRDFEPDDIARRIREALVNKKRTR